MEPSGFDRAKTIKILEEIGKLSTCRDQDSRRIIFTSESLSTEALKPSTLPTSYGVASRVAQLFTTSLSFFSYTETIVQDLPSIGKLISNITECIRRQDNPELFSPYLENAINGLYRLSDLNSISRETDRSDLVKTAIANLKKANDEIKAIRQKKRKIIT